MKRKLLKALAVLTSLVFASCSIFNTFELQEDVRGDALFGINGKMSDELLSYISEYKNRYRLDSDLDFINHLEKHVIYGQV